MINIDRYYLVSNNEIRCLYGFTFNDKINDRATLFCNDRGILIYNINNETHFADTKKQNHTPFLYRCDATLIFFADLF